MTKKELNKLINDFIESKDDNDEDEYYTTDKGMASFVMKDFLEFIKNKKDIKEK